MKKTSVLLVALIAGSVLGGCAYGGVAASGDKVVIARNDALLFGALRKVFVCKVTDGGVTSCQAAEAP